MSSQAMIVCTPATLERADPRCEGSDRSNLVAMVAIKSRQVRQGTTHRADIQFDDPSLSQHDRNCDVSHTVATYKHVMTGVAFHV